MTIEKCKDFIKDGYGTWDDTSKPTTYANMYDFMANQNNVVMNLAQGLWQPSTAYTVGTIIRSPNLPAGCVATCTTAGTSGTTEPKWTAYSTTVADGSCKWKVNTDSQDTMVSERTKAINDMHTTITGERNKAIDDLHSAITKEIANAILQTKKDLYPVGAIFISLTDSRNPADIVGFGTWEVLPAGYGLVAQGTATAEDGTTLTFTAGKKTGEFKHKLSKGELASHSHSFIPDTTRTGASGGSYCYFDTNTLGNVKGIARETQSTGDNLYHNNLSPCLAAYMWERKA
ncbi:phage baseplate protein [uncultured Dialister sp.]|uniref:phage baseplate protein n=1 Tax=uncultured Dialister sp. TaxID=278064 RepID=UPI002599CB11|nr:hypothetical protein [uncultured Dialister sp.]